jgi:hypothetical protein
MILFYETHTTDNNISLTNKKVYMSSMKISEIDLLPTPTGLEQTVVAIAGINKRVTLNSIRSLVTKADVGLSAVDNTADLDKPVSTAVAAAINDKANLAHLHSIANVVNLQNSLDNKSDLTHSHPAYSLTSHIHDLNSVTGLQTALDSKTPVGHTHTEYAPVIHNHDVSDINGLTAQLATLSSTLSAIGHNHQISDVAGLVNALALKTSSADFTTLVDTVANLNTALTSKANIAHNHATSDITGLDSVLQQFASFQTQTGIDILNLQNFDLDVVTVGVVQW